MINFDRIESGYILCDTHEGLHHFRLNHPVRIVQHIILQTNSGSDFIEKTIKRLLNDEKYYYVNKYLVVLECEYINDNEGKIIAAYSYDAMKFGMIELLVNLEQ